MFVKEIIENDIDEIVSKFHSKISTDYTNFSMAFLKQMFACISLPFTIICNKSFSNGTFPDRMKVTKVISIYDGGDGIVFKIMDQYTYYRNSPKILQNCIEII